jgi:hypothetical protein
LIERLLGLEYVALVDPSVAKEAVAHHLLAEEKNETDQDDGRSSGPVGF